MLARVFGRANAAMRVGVRSLFVKIVQTPNPASLKFVPGKKLMPEGRTIDFGNLRSAQRSPLARAVFTVEGVTRVMISTNFLAVTVQDQKCWTIAKPDVFAKLEVIRYYLPCSYGGNGLSLISSRVGFLFLR